jgi:hypothetical protein
MLFELVWNISEYPTYMAELLAIDIWILTLGIYPALGIFYKLSNTRLLLKLILFFQSLLRGL